jgi:ketosteroid isomerase-like protein
MTRTTDEVIDRFNRAFRERDATFLEDIIAPDCVMESVQPAPDGTRYEGYDAAFSSWEALVDDTTSHFEVEDVHTGTSGRSSAGATSGAPALTTRSVASTSCGSSTARSSRPPATRRPRR